MCPVRTYEKVGSPGRIRTYNPSVNREIPPVRAYNANQLSSKNKHLRLTLVGSFCSVLSAVHGQFTDIFRTLQAN